MNNQNVESNREAARRGDGRFGNQERDEATVDLDEPSQDLDGFEVGGKWVMDGAADLDEAADHLDAYAADLRGLPERGWTFAEPVADDRTVLRRLDPGETPKEEASRDRIAVSSFAPDIPAEGDSMRGKWLIDGARTPAEAAERLTTYAENLRRLSREGWTLAAPIDDDYGHLTRKGPADRLK